MACWDREVLPSSQGAEGEGDKDSCSCEVKVFDRLEFCRALKGLGVKVG